MTPFQAIVLESILQTVIGLAFLPILGTIGGLDTILALGGSDDTQIPDDAFPEQSYSNMYYNGMNKHGSMNAMNSGDSSSSFNSQMEMLRMLFTGEHLQLSVNMNPNYSLSTTKLIHLARRNVTYSFVLHVLVLLITHAVNTSFPATFF